MKPVVPSACAIIRDLGRFRSPPKPSMFMNRTRLKAEVGAVPSSIICTGMLYYSPTPYLFSVCTHLGCNVAAICHLNVIVFVKNFLKPVLCVFVKNFLKPFFAVL